MDGAGAPRCCRLSCKHGRNCTTFSSRLLRLSFSSMKKVLVTDYAWPSLDVEREMLAQIGAELMVAEPGAAAELVSLAPDADAILTNWRDVPPGVLDAAPRCVIVSRYGIGVDNIPVERATQLGILVTNVPGFCIDEVGDHALALVLSCARRIVSFDRATSGGTWNLSAIAPGMRRLRGQTLGLVGFGQLGQALAGKAVPLGLQVLAYTPRLPTAPISPGIDGTDDFESLLRQSDYVSLHAPSTPATYHMINETALRLMKPTAYLINTSRGALVDERALEHALRQHWIAGAALDVMTSEPVPSDHPLLGLDNVIVTPHAAFYSEEAIADLRHRATTHVCIALGNELPPNVINMRVVDQPNYRLAAGASASKHGGQLEAK
jgi:D-3-phosphoglycerate dehydrogenase / 2-oxoglutarate reductase